jgi:hypothetical protein
MSEAWHFGSPYLLGLLVVVGMGQVFIGLITGPLWRGIGLPNSDRYGYWHSAVLGAAEGTIYLGALLASRPEFIAVWLGIKTVIRWRHWEIDIAIPGKSENETRWVLGRMAYNLFLLGNALVVLYAGIGWKVVNLANESAWSMAWTVVLGTVGLSAAAAIAVRFVPEYPPLPNNDPRVRKS